MTSSRWAVCPSGSWSPGSSARPCQPPNPPFRYVALDPRKGGDVYAPRNSQNRARPAQQVAKDDRIAVPHIDRMPHGRRQISNLESEFSAANGNQAIARRDQGGACECYFKGCGIGSGCRPVGWLPEKRSCPSDRRLGCRTAPIRDVLHPGLSLKNRVQ